MHDDTVEANSEESAGGSSRRQIAGGLLAGVLAGLVGSGPTNAAKRRHTRRKKRRGRRREAHSAEKPAHAGGHAALKVLTQNLYLGADLGLVATVTTPQQLVAAVTELFAEVQATNFPERATALAAEIAAVEPHLVGLQEVTLWRQQSPSDFPGPPNATDVAYDFLALLLDALAARGQVYRAVATVQNSDLEAPRATPSGLQDIRMTDHNVILARTDLPASVFSVGQAQTGLFAARVPNPLPQLGTLHEGWASVEVVFHGHSLRVVNTHLTRVHPATQESQGNELLTGPLDTPLPTVLLGDLNSAADGIGAVPGHTDTTTYANLLAAEFADAAITQPGQGPGKHPGFTCCQDADLRNATSHLSQRIDHILMRNGLTASSANRVGANPGDRTPSGLWPSDHAGVWAVLHLKSS